VKILLVLLCLAAPELNAAGADNRLAAQIATEVSVVPTHSPALRNQLITNALLRADAVAYVEASAGEPGLRRFLSDSGRDEAKARERIAQNKQHGGEEKFSQMWAQLRADDGVESAIRQWHPKWQQYLPQAMAAVQVGMVGISSSIADSKTLNALERSQLTELQWAITGWIARTDFANAENFQKVAVELRAIALASAVDEVELLDFSTPTQRVAMADQAIISAKKILGLYGVDADTVLRSVKVEVTEQKDDRAEVRTSLTLLGAPISFRESLVWYQDEWMHEYAAMMRKEMEAAEADDSEAIGAVESEFGSDAEASQLPDAEILLDSDANPHAKPFGKTGGCGTP